MSNIRGEARIAVCNRSGQLFLSTNDYGSSYTQNYWKQNYPDLIFDLYYKIPTAKQNRTEITNENLINALETLKQLKAYKGTTYIEATSSDLEPVIKVQYWESEE